MVKIFDWQATLNMHLIAAVRRYSIVGRLTLMFSDHLTAPADRYHIGTLF